MALRAAVTDPSRVTGLVLLSAVDPWRDEPSAQLARAWQAEEDAFAAGDIDAAVAAVLDAWLGPDAPEAVRARVAAMQRRTYIEHPGEPEYATDPLDQGTGVLDAVRCPALCLAAEHDMADFIEAAPRLAGLLVAGRHMVISGAGHLASLEAPERFREVVGEFLAGC